jgi:hypothetical protein
MRHEQLIDLNLLDMIIEQMLQVYLPLNYKDKIIQD